MYVLGIVWMLSWDAFHSHESNEPNRAALLRVRGAIDIGASHGEVLAAYWQHRVDQLRLSADSYAEWSISMPLEFGTSDWKLRIEFQDGKVSAVRVRTSDGPSPSDGPTDKQ